MGTVLLPSFKNRSSELADPAVQIRKVEETLSASGRDSFSVSLSRTGLFPLRSLEIDTLQINVGKLCNQTCRHCHVDAGPDRAETMSRENMEFCLQAIRNAKIKTVDLTGGAPELNENFRWLVGELSKLGVHIIVRSNLTVLTVNASYRSLPDFFASHGVHVISSLPFYSQRRTDSQRGEGVFARSIEAIRGLNAAGYGKENSGLILDLVYNPAGAFLPAGQLSLEAEFKKELRTHGLFFNNLLTIANMPISRFLEYLEVSGNLQSYMDRLVDSYNPAAAAGVMCRSMISVGWDGRLYDCDFNQMLEMPVLSSSLHIRDFNFSKLLERNISVGAHCYGCTAGAGSSCGGATV